MSRWIEKLKHQWAAEPSRQFLWSPVAFAFGIGLYFALPVEPPLYAFLIVLAAAWGSGIYFYRRARVAMLGLMLAAFGLTWAGLMAHFNPPTVLREALEPRLVSGRVADVEQTEHGVRITLDKVAIADYPAEKTPERVRLSVRLKADDETPLPPIGDRLAMMAGTMPPMGPALPHGFDFARYFYFRGIGAVGYGLPPWHTEPPVEVPGIATEFRNWRMHLTESIIDRLGTGVGGVAAGLITGDARAIHQSDYDALRASNLYHIIAISGEHMVVIAGVIFVTLRLLGLLLPARLRFRPEIKSAAALVTLALVTAYLFVTGMPISAVRAYVMIVLVLLAVILRRQVDPMRSLALTAFLMLMVEPANLLEPGFQLSFAATIAIIALVEATVDRARDRGPVGRFFAALLALVLVSVVAEAATAPFVIAQFNTMSPYGVFANLIATWLVSFYLMPAVALFFILLPFGLKGAALALMAWGIKALLILAYWVASFPHAQLFSPSIPGYGVGLFAVGLLWLCLWRTGWRRWGLAPMALGITSLAFVGTPDLLIGPGMKQVALRQGDGYALARGKANSMIPKLWANGLGYKDLAEAEAPAWRCDKLGCVARIGSASIALPAAPEALAQDCVRAQMVVAGFTPLGCAAGKAKPISADALGQGVTALWLGDRVRRESSASWQGRRPWSVRGSLEEED